MTKRTPRRFSPAQKATIVRNHLSKKTKVSELCDEFELQPSVFYEWQKQVFDNLEMLFEQLGGGKRARTARERELSQRDKQIAALTAQLARKDEVIADISEVHLRLKKSIGAS